MPVVCTLRKVSNTYINKEIVPGIYYRGGRPGMYVYFYTHPGSRQTYCNVVHCDRRQDAMRAIRLRYTTLDFVFYR